jgi:hypothetical protein
MIHGLGDPSGMTGDHRVGVVGVMSHDDGVVDRQPSTRAGCHHWYTWGDGQSMKARLCVVQMKTRMVTPGTPRLHMAWARVPGSCVAQAWALWPHVSRAEVMGPHLARAGALGPCLDIGATRGTDMDAEAERGMGVHVWATHGMILGTGAALDTSRDIEATCGPGRGAGATRGMAIVFEVPATEEG